jgi:hypothetical protein
MPPPKDYIKIQYPRKCEHCDYVSNNPSMYHYHNKTHNSIPDGTMCWQGCGLPAKFLNTHGKYTCCKIVQQCPEYVKNHSDRIKKHWVGADVRKEETKKRFLKYCCGVSEVLEKQKTTLKKKYGNFTPEQMKDFRHYARRIRTRAQKWAKEQGYVLGQQTYHVDHKLSIYDAFQLGLSEDVVNHPYNLRILDAKENSSKSRKSIISLDELLEAFNRPCGLE